MVADRGNCRSIHACGCQKVADCLEMGDWLTELRAVAGVLDGAGKSAFGRPKDLVRKREAPQLHALGAQRCCLSLAQRGRDVSEICFDLVECEAVTQTKRPELQPVQGDQCNAVTGPVDEHSTPRRCTDEDGSTATPRGLPLDARSHRGLVAEELGVRMRHQLSECARGAEFATLGPEG